MQITVTTDTNRQATHDLIFSHMSADDLRRFKSENATAYAQVISALEGTNGVCFIANDNGRVIGYLIAGETAQDTDTIRYAELREMRVQKEHQRKGIGTLLVKEFIEWARHESYDRLCVDVYALNDKNIAFYQKLGFIPKTLTLEQWFEE